MERNLKPDDRPILVGEVNPYGADPRYALYPEPEYSAGGRLCRIVLGLEVRDYLRRFHRRNLCLGSWRLEHAREEATNVLLTVPDRQIVVLLGAKVSAAFGVAFAPFTSSQRIVPAGHCQAVILPHPSGRNRMWNEPGAVDLARQLLREVGALPPAPPVVIPPELDEDFAP